MNTPAELIEVNEGRTQELWLSADVAKAELVCSHRWRSDEPIGRDTFRRMKTKKFARTLKGVEQMVGWGESLLVEHACLCVIVEATGPYSLEVLAWLKQLRGSMRVAVVAARRMKAFGIAVGIRNKTDKIDARLIAVYGAQLRPAPTEMLDTKYANLRALMRARQSFVEQVTQLTNYLETVSSEHVHEEVRGWLVKSQQRVIAQLHKEIERIEEKAREHIESHEDLKHQMQLLESIDGVGWTTAATVLGEFGDLRRFRTSRQLTALAGLNPKLRQSGTSDKKARISKEGSTYARRVLYMACMGVLSRRSNTYLSGRYEDLLRRGKNGKSALVANSRKLLTIMRALIVTDRQYDPDRHNRCGKCTTKPVENSSSALSKIIVSA